MKKILLIILAILVAITTVFFFGPGLGYDLLRGDSSDLQTLVLVSANRDTQKPVLVVVQAGDDLESSRVGVVDGQLVVDLIGGYGEYKLGSIWPLLDLDGKDANFQRAVFSFVFEQPVKTVVPLNDLSVDTAQKWSLVKQLLVVSKSSIFDFDQLSQLGQAIFILRHHSTIEVTEYQHIDELTSDLKLQNSVLENSSDECAIAVMNTTDAVGLANRYRQLIETNGGYVVRADDAPKSLEKTIVVIDQQKGEQCNLTARLLTQLFPFEIEVVRAADVYTTYRTPMAILLGEDMAEIQ